MSDITAVLLYQIFGKMSTIKKVFTRRFKIFLVIKKMSGRIKNGAGRRLVHFHET